MPRPKVFDSRVTPESVVSLYTEDKRSTRQVAGLVPTLPCHIPGIIAIPTLRGPGRWLVTSWLGSRGVSLRPPQEGADLAKALTVVVAGAGCVWPNCVSPVCGEAPFEALCLSHATGLQGMAPGWECHFGQCVGSAVWDELWCSYHATKVRNPG